MAHIPPVDVHHQRGVTLQHGEHRIRLKWHTLRRTPSDPAHARANLHTGLERAATLEVDLQFSADGDGVCLHDDSLDAETTGLGPVQALSTHEIGTLRQRDDHGRALDSPPLLLAELVEAARRTSPPPGTIQLDLKAAALDTRTVARFAATLGDAAPHFTLSGEDWPLVERLAGAVPGVRLGFEPLRLFRNDPPRTPHAFRALAEHMLTTAPGAEIVYLHTGLALRALDAGENLIGRLRDAGRSVDCWTIDPHRSHVAATLERLADAGCDQITTNAPEALEAVWSDRSEAETMGRPFGR